MKESKFDICICSRTHKIIDTWKGIYTYIHIMKEFHTVANGEYAYLGILIPNNDIDSPHGVFFSS